MIKCLPTKMDVYDKYVIEGNNIARVSDSDIIYAARIFLDQSI